MSNNTIKKEVMVWSDEKPTEPGWYWFRDKQIKQPAVIFINGQEIIMDGYQWAKVEEPTEPEMREV